MDNLTHTLTAIAMARAGGRRLGPHAAWILVLAANAPDVDVVSRIVSTTNYLHYHRGITHSFFAAPFLALGVIAIVALSRRRARSQQPWPLARAYGVALFGVLFGHLFLDWSTSYGTRLLAPFSGRWLSWDAIPIVDAWLLVVLIAGLTIPAFFRLISSEIGAGGGGSRGGAAFALVFLLAWFGFRGLLHSRALMVLDSHLYHGLEPRRIGAYADIVNPFRWYGVVETSEVWELAEVDVLEEFDPGRTRLFRPPDPSPALDAARRTPTLQVFLDFARFPFSYVEQEENGYHVVYRDLRFDYNVTGAKGFVAQVWLDGGWRVLSEQFNYRSPNPVR